MRSKRQKLHAERLQLDNGLLPHDSHTVSRDGNHGVPCEFLAYEVKGRWSYEDALAITLLHDVLVRPCGFGSEVRLAPLWKAMDDFGTAYT